MLNAVALRPELRGSGPSTNAARRIKKPKTSRYPSLKGTDPKFRRNHRHALHGTMKALVSSPLTFETASRLLANWMVSCRRNWRRASGKQHERILVALFSRNCGWESYIGNHNFVRSGRLQGNNCRKCLKRSPSDRKSSMSNSFLFCEQ
jgi:hypothetical protein